MVLSEHPKIIDLPDNDTNLSEFQERQLKSGSKTLTVLIKIPNHMSSIQCF